MRMSLMLRKLLPKQPWLLLANDGRQRHVMTIPFDSEREARADAFLRAHAINEVKMLAGKPTHYFFRPIDFDEIKEVVAIGVRMPLAQRAAIDKLQSPPAICFEHKGEIVAAWRFEQPVPVLVASKAEEFLARHFRGQRLNFFLPLAQRMPYDTFIDPKRVEDVVRVVSTHEEDVFLSATSEPEKRSWVIDPLVQRKKITLLSGEAGMGKSQISLDFTMRVTRGIGLPGQTAPSIGGAIVNENEDDWREDVIPRLIAIGADRRLIKGIHAEDLHTEAGIARLEKVRRRFEDEVGVAVALTVLSPYMACFGGGSNQEAHMREKLAHISKWAKDTNMAVLGVAHLDKQGGVAGAATHRRLARGSWKVVVNDDDPEPNPKKKQRLLVADKANNAPDDFALAYRIKGVTLQGSRISTSKIVWEEPLVPLGMAANEVSNPSVRKYSDTTRRYVSAIQDIVMPGGVPIHASSLKKELANRGLTNVQAIYEALDALKIVRGDRNARADSKPLIPPSEWPRPFNNV